VRDGLANHGGHHFVPGGPRRFNSSNQFSTTLICVVACSCSASACVYFSISEAQFKWMESGAALASSIFVMIKNLCPSALTS
jgi:hypothetical protein